MVLTGLNLGLMYALIAIGLTLIFGVMRIIQYAHGEMYMLGAFTLYYWHAELGLPYWPGVAFSAVLIFCVGAVLQVVLFRPCLLYTSPRPRDRTRSCMPSSA